MPPALFFFLKIVLAIQGFFGSIQVLELFVLFLFYAVVKVIIFLIVLCDSSLLMYRNTIEFCTLFLYPATSLNSCVSSN